MKEMNEILGNWNLDRALISEADVERDEKHSPNVWIINEKYILKKYSNIGYLERSIGIVKVLAREQVPVAVPLTTVSGADYVTVGNQYYCLYPKLPGKGHINYFEGDFITRTRYYGEIIGYLHHAFLKCDDVIECPDINLFEQVMNWSVPVTVSFMKENARLIQDIIEEYRSQFTQLYLKLPKQVIHRDFHGENLLFEQGKLTGYVDFDLSQRSARIFDPCYMSTGILARCFEDPVKSEQWIEIYKSILKGYDSVCHLTEEEKQSMVYILLSIQFIFTAYFAENGYSSFARANINILKWLYENRERLQIV